jgi:pilus assembly protein CpaB
MSSITASANAERTNRWLLIGAVILAIATGVLVFAAVANFGSDDGEPAAAVADGDSPVLVAVQNIAPNTRITEDMVEVRSVAEASLVEGAVGDKETAVGEVTRVEVLRGEQISASRLGSALVADEDATCLACKIPPGKRAIAVDVSESTSVAGLIVPGDRVDVLAIFTEDFDGTNQEEVTRVETLLQNVEVLAFAQVELENLPAADVEGTPIATDRSAGVLGGRPDDAEANPSAGTATLALSPAEVQAIVAAQARGELTLSLRPLGDEAQNELSETNLDDHGFLGPLPRP